MLKISRDNLRHLTGLGRDYADVIESVLDNPIRRFLDDPTSQLTEDECRRCALSIRIDMTTGAVSTKATVLPEEPLRSHDGIPGKGSRVTCLTLVTGPTDGPLEIYEVPTAMLFENSSDLSKWYHIYKHEFLYDGDGNGIPNSLYIGLTKRGWRTRWAEHNRSADNGSHYRFHKAIRTWRGVATGVKHSIIALAASEGTAMAIEERLVDAESLYPLGLNMVPGGNKGLAYLRSIGAIGKNERVTPDDRQNIINRYFERASRKGLPNLLAAANWLDASYAERVMCAAEDRLKPTQIRDARFLASMGHDIAAITKKVGARNDGQIKRLLAGQTYSRVA